MRHNSPMYPANSRALSADDRLDLMDLYARYAWSMDSGELDAYEATLAEDARLVGIGTEYRGKSEIRGWEQAFLKDPGFPGTEHFYTNFLIRGSGGEEAEVWAYVARLYRLANSSSCQILWLGYYNDTCTRRSGEWQFLVKRPHPSSDLREQKFGQSAYPAPPASIYPEGAVRE